jgi:hypothetical protein
VRRLRFLWSLEKNRVPGLKRLAGNDTSAGAGDLVRGRVDDIVLVVTVPEPSVGSIAGVPGACVEGAVGTKGHLVLGEDVRVEEVARLVLAIRVGVSLLVIGLGLACSGAEGRVVGVIVEKTHAVVGIVAVVQGRRDTSWEGCTSLEVGGAGEGLANLAVAVATGDHNVEGLAGGVLRTAPLAFVGGSLACDGVTVKRTLDIGDRLGVGATILRLELGVAFVEDVEAKAVLLTIAGVGTTLNVVAIVRLVGQVANLLRAASLVDEGLLVAGGSIGSAGGLPQLAVGVEVGFDTAIPRDRNNTATVSQGILVLMRGILTRQAAEHHSWRRHASQ